MPRKLFAVALFSLLAIPVVRADGCKFTIYGHTVPEREQRAFIEWEAGIETMYVAALSDPRTTATVWIVPVRAPAKSVQAEPVDDFPVVASYETLRERAEKQLRYAMAVAAVLNTGGCCCPSTGYGVHISPGCGGPNPAAKPKGVDEVSRVERLGMVVTVVSAESRADLEQYLEAQGVKHASVDLSSIDSYFGFSDYAFVCGWVATREKPATATGLKVVFPSPTVWFPLRASRVYREPIDTVVYVRGFVKPAPNCELPGLKCEYIFGGVQSWALTQAFSRGRREGFGDSEQASRERMTRVTLYRDPQMWDRDLELVPGTTRAGTVALAVTGWFGRYGPLWSALLGAILGLAIAPLTVPRAERRRADWVGGILTGAAIAASILASALLFTLWRELRFTEGPRQPRIYLVLPALAISHFLGVFIVCNSLIGIITGAG